MLLNRFLLSLVAALFLSTLASANSTNVTAFLHSGAFNSANHAGPFSTVAGNGSPAKFAAYSNHRSIGAIGNTGTDAAVSGKVTYGGGSIGPEAGGSPFPRRKNGPCCEARLWVGGKGIAGPSKPGLSTPEPGTLMLLSTGLMGIGGMVRRKLRLG